MNYEKKYLKYKNKYLQLKKQTGGLEPEATKRDVESWRNIAKFIYAEVATTYDNLLLDGSISNADVRNESGSSGLHWISMIGRIGSSDNDVDTDILLSYLLTCDRMFEML